MGCGQYGIVPTLLLFLEMEDDETEEEGSAAEEPVEGRREGSMVW